MQALVISGYCDTSHGSPIQPFLNVVPAANTLKVSLLLTPPWGNSRVLRAGTFSFPHVTPAAATHNLWAFVIIFFWLQDGLSSSLLATWIHALRIVRLPEAHALIDEAQEPQLSGVPAFLPLALSTLPLQLCFLVSSISQPLPRKYFPLSLEGFILGTFFSFRF